jgi:transcriptional regulator with XRE-family HTH domain
MKGGGTITTRVEEIRKERGLTQTELARRLGVQQSTISLIENEARTPSAGLLLKIADELGVTIDELIDRKAG